MSSALQGVAAGSYREPRYNDAPTPDTLTIRTQRICSTSGRIVENLRELAARLVMSTDQEAKLNAKILPPDPSHSAHCLELTEQRLGQIEEMLSSLLTRV